MTESTTPPLPPTLEATPKKKTSIWVWLLGGCLLLLLLVGGSCAVMTYFVAQKVKDVAGDFEDNPAKTAAELIVKLNPDLDLVESEDADGTITVRNNRTGEESTFDYSEIAEGRFSFSNDDGEVRVDVHGGGDGGLITVTSEAGDTVVDIGGGNTELPSWVPELKDASTSNSAYTSRSEEEASGLWIFETESSVDATKDLYESQLEAEGYVVTVRTHPGTDGSVAVVTGSHDDPQRAVTATIQRTGDLTQLTLQYNGKN